ncbi:helix-turn-helix domain-containing protein, partial [Erysipelatoclostridium ramosum]
MDIGKNIVRLRNEKGYTQEALASLLHVSCAAVSKWEHGSSCPDISTLPILARIFDISIDELLNFEKNLSKEQVKELCEEMLQQFQQAPFAEAMAFVRRLLRQYPNSEDLKL